MKIKNWVLAITLVLQLISVAQTGPGGVGTNDGSSSLKLWLDANKGIYKDTNRMQVALHENKIMFWEDLSGSSNHVMALSDTSSPSLYTKSNLLNQQNAIRFFRNRDTLTRRNFLTSKTFAKTNDITIYCVFHAVTRAGGNNVTPYQAQNYNANMWYNGAGLVEGGVAGFVNDVSLAFCDTSLAAGAGDSTTNIDYCVKTPASLRKTYFALLQKEAWTGKLSIAHNNVLPTTYQAGAQPINNSEKYFIGSTSDVYTGKTSPFFDGYIANVLVYNKLLNAAEKIILENYLSAKYEIPLLTNDLYKFDEAHLGNYDYELIGIGKAADGTSQLSAKGEGILEINNAHELARNEFIFVGHNGKSLTSSTFDLPVGAQLRLEREWICSKTGNTQKVDVFIDGQDMSFLDDYKDVALLIDTDNNNSFADEKVGEGIIPLTEISSLGRLVFRGVNLKHGNKFTVAKIKQHCLGNCEAYFSPDGDGVADVFYIENSGKTSIYDRAGKLIKTLQTPAYWDGTNESGQPAAPGIYFLLTNDEKQETVTLIK